MKNLIIIGVGGFAREVYWQAQNSIGFDTEWQIKGFLDGDTKLAAEEYAKLPADIPLLGDINSYEIKNDDVFTCAVGTPKVRRKLIEKILSRGGKFINVISNFSFVVPTAKIGNGVIMAIGTAVSDNVEIGDFAAINGFTTIGHDAQIGKYSCIMAHVGVNGFTKIGEEVFIGGNAVLVPNAEIEDGAYVGAGSVVLKKVRAGAKVFGNPAAEI